MATSTITNTIRDLNGDPVSGVSVIARLRPGPGFRVSDGAELVPEETTTSDVNGAWTLTLERNLDITPAGSWYEIEEDLTIPRGQPRIWAINVGTINASLAAALVSPPPSASGPNYLTQEAGDLRYEALGKLTPHGLVSSSHTASGLTAGTVLRATGATTFAFQAIQDADIPASIARDTEIITTHGGLTGVTADQHHAQTHVLAGADHTASGLIVGQVLRASGATTFAWASLAHADLASVTADQHHAQTHVLAGADHTASGLVAGQVLRASGATTFAWASLAHADLASVTADQHHAQSHILASADHTASGLVAGQVLRASGATTFAWASLAHGDLGSVT
ncbi:MAG: hypothetical protein ACREJL_01225, partial [Candidatus Methylomirabilales bacterium]